MADRRTFMTAAAVVAAIFAAVLAWEIFGTLDFQPEATLSGWDATVTYADDEPEQMGGWQTRVIPATLWQPGNHWCALANGGSFG